MGFARADRRRGSAARCATLPDEVLLDPARRERGLLPAEPRCARLIDDHRSGRADNADKLWALLQLELWLRTYIDAVEPRPPVLSLGSA